MKEPTENEIKRSIDDIRFVSVEDQKLVFCELVLKNGYIVRGFCTFQNDESTEIDKHESEAYEDALKKCKELYVFLSYEKNYVISKREEKLKNAITK